MERPCTSGTRGDGFLYEREFDNADFLQKLVVPTSREISQMVASGRVDLTLGKFDVINYLLRADLSALRPRMSLDEQPITKCQFVGG